MALGRDHWIDHRDGRRCSPGGDAGGVDGVVRLLNGFRFMAPSCLLPNGRQKYRFVGLFDDDRAGREAVRRARELDKSAIEYRDVFRMRPVMPLHTDRDPSSLQKRFEAENLPYRGIDWELEDLLPESFHKPLHSHGQMPSLCYDRWR
jgi:hypothetical protein